MSDTGAPLLATEGPELHQFPLAETQAPQTRMSLQNQQYKNLARLHLSPPPHKPLPVPIPFLKLAAHKTLLLATSNRRRICEQSGRLPSLECGRVGFGLVGGRVRRQVGAQIQRFAEEICAVDGDGGAETRQHDGRVQVPRLAHPRVEAEGVVGAGEHGGRGERRMGDRCEANMCKRRSACKQPRSACGSS